ncbi:hypothetical protein CUN63_06225 [Pseudomonas sp. ACM7]|nr:hypothetical protein CUN63_06225 [Pseudomonas sp. ACM7]
MGAGLLAKGPSQTTSPVRQTPLSRASPLPQGIAVFQKNPAPHQPNDNSSYSISPALLDFAPLVLLVLQDVRCPRCLFACPHCFWPWA